MPKETTLFLRQFLSNPLQVASVVPSSRFLARAMAQGLGPNSGRVVEFGPGTGVLTNGILETCLPPENLTLFEMSPGFSKLLKQKFPNITVHNAPAQSVVGNVEPGVEAVISGLPLLSMPMAVRESIVKAAFEILAPNGRYVQFTYSTKPALSAEQLSRLGLKVVAGPKVWLNIPPARIFIFKRA